jgi:3-hydroxymyristoyl/3-hydroxydecanoyl-(acyl carrier protein) dehydratase
VTTQPVVLRVEPQGGGVRIALHVQPDLQWFEGHFPGTPLLPAVVQTGWAVAFARQHFDMPPRFLSMSNMKFMRFIMPGMRVALQLRYIAPRNELSFQYLEGEAVSASGRMRFGE